MNARQILSITSESISRFRLNITWLFYSALYWFSIEQEKCPPLAWLLLLVFYGSVLPPITMIPSYFIESRLYGGTHPFTDDTCFGLMKLVLRISLIYIPGIAVAILLHSVGPWA